MTTDRAKDQLARDWRAAAASITLHPAWELDLRPAGIEVTFTMTGPDSRTGEPGIVQHRRLVPDVSESMSTLAWLWSEAWAHEADEWFKVNGQPRRDPHRRT